jgi:hypothetical protein
MDQARSGSVAAGVGPSDQPADAAADDRSDEPVPSLVVSQNSSRFGLIEDPVLRPEAAAADSDLFRRCSLEIRNQSAERPEPDMTMT